ncbi:MAG: hypothetical protein SOI66_08550 [Bifidobacterium sp.]|jgi:hypothetical protein
MELAWDPGVGRVDFGQAGASIAGVERGVHVLVVSFPFSSMRFCVALPGESAECVCSGLVAVFGMIGRVPRILVFDAFRARYRIGEARFCNPYSGNEKGGVGTRGRFPAAAA